MIQRINEKLIWQRFKTNSCSSLITHWSLQCFFLSMVPWRHVYKTRDLSLSLNLLPWASLSHASSEHSSTDNTPFLSLLSPFVLLSLTHWNTQTTHTQSLKMHLFFFFLNSKLVLSILSHLMWWSVLIINLIKHIITWAYLWRIFLIMLIEWEDTSTVGGTIPCLKSWAKWRMRAEN